MSETLSPDPPSREEDELRALYEEDENGISPVAQMQQNLIELVSIAATASVIAFALHHPDAGVVLDSFKLPFSNSEFDIATLKKPTIEGTIQAILQETYLGKGSDTPLYHYGSFLGTVSAAPAANNATPIEESDPYSPLLSGAPVTAEVMKESVERLNQILQSHLEVVVAPGQGYKKYKTALNKLIHEKKGCFDDMKDLIRIMIVFGDSRLRNIFTDTLLTVADYAQKLSGSPLKCSPIPLPELTPNLEWLFLKKDNLWPWLKIKVPLQQKESFQPSGYHGDYFNGIFFSHPSAGPACEAITTFGEVQICHKSMWDVYRVTHDIYDIERILDEIDVIRRQEQEASQSLSGEELQKRVSDLKEEKIQKIKKAFTPLKISLDAFVVKLLPDMSHPKLNQEGAWFQKITHHVMALLGEKGESVAETFQQKRKSFDEAAGLVFKPSEEDSEEDQDRHLQELGEQAWELRQLCHLVSVYGRPTDEGYKERYKKAAKEKLRGMVNDAVDLENDSSRIGVYIRDCLEKFGVTQRNIINPTSTVHLVSNFLVSLANTTRQ
jgi:hypothetical protein